jgi:hypothetical protein
MSEPIKPKDRLTELLSYQRPGMKAVYPYLYEEARA